MAEELYLSGEALAALKEFAIERGIEVQTDSEDLRKDIQQALDSDSKDAVFIHTFPAHADEEKADITIRLKGLRRDIGQTLESTGLTLWPAGDVLSEFIYSNQDMFRHKRALELGCGLGLCGILASNFTDHIVFTDGDDATLQTLVENCKLNQMDSNKYSCNKLFWGESLDECDTKFDLIFGADIVYEKEYVTALFKTVTHLLDTNGIFILSFTRRNIPIDYVLSIALKNELSCPQSDQEQGIFLFYPTHQRNKVEIES